MGVSSRVPLEWTWGGTQIGLFIFLFGLLLVISDALLMPRRPLGAWIYVDLFVATLIWALWESARRRNALMTTDAEDKLMASAAIMGESSHPVNG